jgi:hypothetical protein
MDMRMYYQRAVFCSFFCGQKESMCRIFVKKFFKFMVGSVCRMKLFTTGSKNSRGLLKVADDACPGRPIEIATDATVLKVEELIRADRRIVTDSVATTAVENNCSNMWHTV